MKQSKVQWLKAYFSSEREKIKNFTWKQKLEYIWGYYSLWIVGIVGAVFLISYMIFRFTTTVKEYWLFGVFTNTYAEVGNHSELWEGFESYAGFDLKQKNLEFNCSSYFDPSKTSGTNNSYFQSFVAYVESGNLDFLTMEEEGLVALGSSGRLMDLNSEEALRFREKYEDRFVYSVPYDEEYSREEVPVGIDVSDSILITKYHIYEKSCILGISAYSKNLESVELFLKYIYGEE